MIRLIVRYGDGSRKAPVISDSLIPNIGIATIRAQQELAAFSYIVVARDLSLPHDPNAGIGGDHTNEFIYQPLNIYGNHLITSRSINLAKEGCTDTVSIEQYREMYTGG